MSTPSRIQRSSLNILGPAGTVCMVALMMLGLQRPIAGQATAVREADRECGRCHADIYRHYLLTPMANASGAAGDNLKTGTFVHKSSATWYSLSVNDGRPVLTYRHSDGSAGGGELPVSYFLGSGHLGITYLYSTGKYLFESPVAWYAASQAFDMKPGLAEIRKMPPPLPMQSNCLRCHMSSVEPADAGTINRYEGLPFLHTGITCEACHGDSKPHTVTGGKAPTVNPARLDAARRDSVCISCHLEGDVSVERAGHSPLNFRPGELISDYMAYYVHAGSNLAARGVSEVEQLSQSVCKRTSGDRMSCTSCHDPHYTPTASQRVAFFRGKCLACHNQPQFAAAHHPETQDCTSCHMPQNGAANILHVAWTDHRILRIPGKTSAEPTGDAGNEMKAVFSPGATQRDMAMAYYQALLEGDRSFEAAAWQQLNAVRDSISNDTQALDALGNLSAERGDQKTAEQCFRRVLELAPSDLTALSNLGILLAKAGKLNDAIPLLRAAFARNQDIPGLVMNLSRVECMAGDTPAARGVLLTALQYCPELEDVRRLLSQTNDCGAAAGN